MSNMIKAYSVRYDQEVKMTIDTHFRIDKEIETRRNQVINDAEKQNVFVEGLKAVVIDPVPTQEEITQKSSNILEDARKEAKNIVDMAKKEADQLKNEAFSASQKKGYDDGMLQGKKEIKKLKAELEERSHKLQEEYDRMAFALEPQMVDIIASLVEKITGIVVEDREEVILYLVDKALKNMDKCNEYTIRVSKDDYEYISMRKNLLLGAIEREVPLYIVEDTTLKENQCLIETEIRVINCSLDIQLNNLIMDLKLIGGI